MKFIYFDLDDTLLDHRHAERKALVDLYSAFEEVFGHLDVKEVQEVYHRHNVDLWTMYAEGGIDKEALKRLRFERLLEALALEGVGAGELHTHYMDRYATHWAFPEEARAAFHTLADRLPVGVLTNGFGEVQHAKLERFPEIRERIKTLVISDEVGYMKPHPRIFEHATEVAGVAPDEVLYVGDSYRSDVQGGRKAGWQVAWYTAEAGQEDDDVFRFQNWSALVDEVGRRVG